MSRRGIVTFVGALLVAVLTPFCAFAQGTPPAAQETQPVPEDPATLQAREHFLRGVELVKRAAWAEALVEFEKSDGLRPHPVTTFNQGACQRALGRYALARDSLRRALATGSAGTELPEMYAADARAFLDEIERVLVHLKMTVKPQGSRLTVDGRPIRVLDGGAYAAGLSPVGQGSPVPAGAFELVLDPGAHVFSFARKGYADAVVNRSYQPGARAELNLELDLLPATLTVTANVPGAIVSIGARDLGPVPVEVRRPPGSYPIVVRKEGYEPYEANVTLRAGADTALRARLSPERVPVTKRWWFWTGAAVVVSGGILATYALTREDPPPEPYDGGTTGWVVQPR